MASNELKYPSNFAEWLAGSRNQAINGQKFTRYLNYPGGVIQTGQGMQGKNPFFGQAKNMFTVENMITNLISRLGPEALGLPAGTTPEQYMASWNAWMASDDRKRGRRKGSVRFSDYLANNPIGGDQVGIQQSSPWTQALVRGRF